MAASDIEEFYSQMQDVKPLTKDNHVRTLTPVQPTLAQLERRKLAEQKYQQGDNYLSSEYVNLLDPLEILSFKKSGVQDGVFKKLRLAKYDIEAVLDLQRMSVKQARGAIYEFVNDCLKRNIRTVLIRHGIGKHSKLQPALIKSYVYKWLQQIPDILAFHSALRPHGGAGSLYVMIRKSEAKKQQNREVHAKRCS